MGKRIVSALALVAIGISVILYGSLPLFLWVTIAALTTTYELTAMYRKHDVRLLSSLSYIVIFATMLTAFLKETQWIWQTFPVMVIVTGIIIFSLMEVISHRYIAPSNHWVATLKIIAFICGTFTYIYLLRYGKNGLINLLYTCIIIWTTDTCALFGGKLFGRHKLSNISPGKTIEGSISGVAGSLIVASVFLYFVDLSVPLYLGLAVFISVLAQFSDLHESLVKRHFNVKDSSNLIPGHGGIYDRADSYLLVLPMVFFFFNIPFIW